MRCLALVALLSISACGEVTIRADAPSAGTVTVSVDASVVIRQGSTARAAVTLVRDNEDRPITVTVTGLGDGVTAAPVVIDAGATTGELELQATATATHGVFAATVVLDVGSATDGLEVVVAGAPGALDQSFAGDGTALPDLGTLALGSRGLAITPAGIVVTGFVLSSPYQALTARFREDGSLDPSFGSNGFVSTGVAVGNGVGQGIAVTVDMTGRIIAAGIAGGASASDNDFGVFVYSPGGVLDQTFAGTGVASHDPGMGYGELHNAVVASDGSILVGGTLFGATAVSTTYGLRYSSLGVRDPAYNINEPNVTVEGAALQPDGKLVMVGANGGSFWLCRYSSTGARDPAFGTGVTTSFTPAATTALANGVIIQTDGKLLVVGTCRVGSNDVVCLARYNANGSLDVTFGTSGKIITSTQLRSQTATSVVQAGNHVYFGGRSGTLPAVVRLGLDGQIDTAFGVDGVVTVDFGLASGAQTGVFGLGLDPRGRVVISADVGPAGGQRMGVARLWP